MQLRGFFWLVLIVGCSSVSAYLCGDGIVEFDTGEMCDDGNLVDADGCTNCTVDDMYTCMTNSTGTNSICEPVLLDLNVFDNSTLDYTNEYFDLDEVVFLSDPNNTNMTAFQVTTAAWDSVFVVILQADPAIDEEVDVFTREAFDLGRTTTDYSGLFQRSRLMAFNDPRLAGLDIDASLVVDGMQVTGDIFFGGDTVLDETEVSAVLSSAGYIARQHPGYNRRDYCIIAVEGVVSTTACIGLYFIGRNDDPPTVTYTAVNIASFTEGQSEFVAIIDGTLQVSDPDHPTRYLMESAQATIQGFVPGYPEWVSVTYENPEFTYQFDDVTGTLTITGNATTDIYAQLLSNITYFNNMTEPVGSSRIIELTVFDGIFTSNAALVEVTIVNTNDEPVISLDREDPIIQDLSVDYTEGDGPVLIVPLLVVVDTDPTAMIQRVVVYLANPLDGSAERLYLQNSTGLELANDTHVLELSGLADRSVYTEILRTLTYEHQDALPGNPTASQPRMIVFFVEDDRNASNLLNSVLMLSIIPVNDPPILLFISDDVLRGSPEPILSGAMTTEFSYTEDDPAINIGIDIYLRDVDSNITNATITATDLLNRGQDEVFVSDLLSAQYGIAVSSATSNGGLTRELTLTGEATPTQYEEVLRSLSYQNLLTNNSVSDGVRSISITVLDSGGLYPVQPIAVYVTVMDRNDGPVIDLGAGDEQDLTVTFVENGNSIPIALAHLLDIMDEEGHNISMMSVELTATNGQLDPSDTIFVRTPLQADFLQSLLQNPPTQTYIMFTLNATVDLYVDALTAIYYDNSEPEPTYFSNATAGELLDREIVIQITDTNFGDQTTTEIRVSIRIQLINDNRPRIIIDSDPSSCSEDCRDLEESLKTVNRRRRDVKATPTKKRRRRAVEIGDYDNSMAPQVKSVTAGLTLTSNGIDCIDYITVNFDPETNTPIVELQHRLDQVLTFDLTELASAPKYGMWLDCATLMVLFPECVEWEGGTTSGRERPVFLIFESDRGTCGWDTSCNNGVCFFNNTGCPATGFYQVDFPTLDSASGIADYEDSESFYYQSSPVIYFVVILAFAVAGLAVTCGLTRRHWKSLPKSASLLPNKPITTKPSTPLQKTAPRPTVDSLALEMTPPSNNHVQELTPVSKKLTISNTTTSDNPVSETSAKKSPANAKAVSPSERGNSKLPPPPRGQGGKLKKLPPTRDEGTGMQKDRGQNATKELETRIAQQRDEDTSISLQRADEDAHSQDAEVETLHASAEQSGDHTHPHLRRSRDQHVANSNPQSVSQREQFNSNERSIDGSSSHYRSQQLGSFTQRPH